jgi:hypothetical protein
MIIAHNLQDLNSLSDPHTQDTNHTILSHDTHKIHHCTQVIIIIYQTNILFC